MRAVKSVLVMSGSLKRSEPDLPEETTLIRAMTDSNVPKFLDDDLPLFNAIVRDLFPGNELPEVSYEKLFASLEKTMDSVNLQKDDAMYSKIV